MATIRHFTTDDLLKGTTPDPIYFDGSVGDYLVKTFKNGDAFSVFDGQPSIENDITFNYEFLKNGFGSYVITETPSGELAIPLIISLVISVAVVALTPKPELPENVNRSQESPNNQLSGRSNRARPLQRIPDIRGQVVSVPDIIQPTYSVYQVHREIEKGYYCVGRGQYLIENLKDGDTPLQLITGATAGIYYPFNSPNAGAPDIAINGHISEPIVSPYRSNQVNGITLSTEFDDALIDATKNNLGFGTNSLDPNKMLIAPITIPTNFQWPTIYEIGTTLTLENVIVAGFNISGTYLITDYVSGFEIIEVEYLGSPLPTFLQNATSGTIISNNASEYTDWAYLTAVEFNTAVINVIAPNGMYKDTGAPDLEQFTVEYEIQLEGVDAEGNPDGNLVILNDDITGSDQRFKGNTTEYEFPAPTRFRCRAKRLTPRFTGSALVVDEIKLNDVYGLENIDVLDFGDVTTIQTKTQANQFSTAIKERQLNCIATELLNEYQGGGVFAPTLTPNKRAVQSFIRDSIDPVIGNRTLDEIDADGILALDNEINSYFGNPRLGEFSYTFDSTNITFQDYAQIVFNAINCIAYREAGKISALFERVQDTPAMLFTHRSKGAGSESHSRDFNPGARNDGVEFTYVEPATNTSEVIYIPENKSAVNPKKFEIPGIRNRGQALIRARREYNKLIYQKINMEFEATAEGRYIRPNDMIAAVKGTRIKTFDGEILDQAGLLLTLSADVEFSAGDHYIILKNNDGSTESILVTPSAQTNQVILNNPPIQTIRTGIDSRRTEFSFGSESAQLAERWLITDIDVSEKWVVKCQGINYTDDYYKDDSVNVNAFSDGFSNGFS